MTSSAPNVQEHAESHKIVILGRQSKTSLASSSQPHGGDQAEEHHLAPVQGSYQHSATSLSYTGTATTAPSQVLEGASYVSEFEGMVQGTKGLSIKDNDGDNENVSNWNTFFSFPFDILRPYISLSL